MPLPSSKLTPEREQQLRAILLEPLPDAKSMTSLQRLLRVNLYREMMQGGIEVPPSHIAHGIELLAVDRTERTTAAAAERKVAKKAASGANYVGPEPSASDL